MAKLSNASIRTRGFTLIEMIVVISVLVALSALLVPAISGIMSDSKITEVATLYDTLKKACLMHNVDTGQFAREYTGGSYSASTYHQLYMEQSYTGWNGPYLEEPLTAKHHPWGGTIHLYSSLLVNGLTGWDLDADGSAELTSQETACVLYMNNVPEGAADALDEALDMRFGTTNDWKTSGRIQYGASGRLWMLVYRE